jgi:hypothetical protein
MRKNLFMEDTMISAQDNAGKEDKQFQTPHELYKHHLQHPDEEITDDDIRNLKIDTGAVAKDHQLTTDETITSTISKEESSDRDNVIGQNDTNGEKPKASPYDILSS